MFSYQLKISQLPIRVSIVEMRALGEIALIVSMPMQTFNSQFIQCSSFLLGYFNNHSKLINAKWHITKNGNAVITLWWNLASLSSVCWLLKPWYVFYLMNYYVHCVQSSKSDICNNMYKRFKQTLKFNWNRIIRLQRIVPEISHLFRIFFILALFENILRAFFIAINNNEPQITNSKSIIYIKCFMFCKKWKNNPKYKNYGSRIH